MVMKLRAFSEDGGWKEKKQNKTKSNQRKKETTNKQKKKNPVKAFYLPIKMSQAVNAQTSLPFVGLATMLQ